MYVSLHVDFLQSPGNAQVGADRSLHLRQIERREVLPGDVERKVIRLLKLDDACPGYLARARDGLQLIDLNLFSISHELCAHVTNIQTCLRDEKAQTL